jgi:hypothetical protein
VNGTIGCCDTSGVLHYCNPTMTKQTCTGGNVCGWNTSKGWYSCVAPPGGSDPSNTYPKACP